MSRNFIINNLYDSYQYYCSDYTLSVNNMIWMSNKVLKNNEIKFIFKKYMNTKSQACTILHSETSDKFLKRNFISHNFFPMLCSEIIKISKKKFSYKNTMQ